MSIKKVMKNRINRKRKERKRISEILAELRNIRDTEHKSHHTDFEWRQLYNAACDRLDVLETKLFERDRENSEKS